MTPIQEPPLIKAAETISPTVQGPTTGPLTGPLTGPFSGTRDATSGRPYFSWPAILAFIFLTLVFLPSLWLFQILRSQHYEIVRDPVQVDCVHCVNPTLGKVRTFRGLPEENSGPVAPETAAVVAAVAAPAVAAAASTKNLFRAWCHDLPMKAGEGADVRLNVGSRGFSASCGSAQKAGELLEGRDSARAFVYFLFLPKLKSDVAWANSEMRPNLILLNWPDPVGFLLHAFSIVSSILALACAGFLVLGFQYARFHWREILDLGSRRQAPSRFWIAVAASALALLVAYVFPIFHNVVLLYFGFVALGVTVFLKLFRLNRDDRNGVVPIHLKQWLLLLPILGVAFALRAYKADWGFPLLLHTDEYAITDFPAEMARHNSLNPIDYERPNHASIYLASMVYGIASQARFHQPLTETFAAHAPFYHWLSRICVAMLGVAVVWLAFLIGAEWNPRAGWIAALVFACFPPFIQHSHFVTPDISLTLAVLGVMLFSMRYIRAPDLGNLFSASACAALATVEKYPGVLSLACLAAALWIVHSHSKRTLALNAARALLAFSIVLFLTSPYLATHPHLVLLNTISESRPTHPGHDGLGFFGNLWFYVRGFGFSASLLISLAGLWGAIALIRNQGKSAGPVFTGWVFWIILSALPLHWERWSLPMTVTPLLLAAFGIARLWDIPAHWPRVGRVGARLAFGLLLTAALGDLLLKDAVVLADLGARDTRLIGLDRFPELGITAENSLSGHYTPLVPTWSRGFDFISSYRDTAGMRGKPYAVVSSDLYGRYFREPQKYPEECRFYTQLFASPQVLAIRPQPMPWRFARFDDFGNLREGLDWLRAGGRLGGYSVGPDITVYALTAAKE